MIFNAFGENFSQYKSSKMKKKPPIHAGIALFYNPRVKLRKKAMKLRWKTDQPPGCMIVRQMGMLKHI